MEKFVLKCIGVGALFFILIQASIFVFNNISAWGGIVSGVASIVICYIAARSLVKSLNKPKM